MKLLLFAGPTGGHFFPALAFCQEWTIRHPETEILFVTGERGRGLAQKIQEEFQGQFVFLPDFPFPRPNRPDFLIFIWPFLCKLLFCHWKSRKILDAFQPNLCVGFGSYVAFPGLWACRRRRIPTMIHEQNRKMGRANRKLVRHADRVAVTFDDTEGLPRDITWTVTGTPLRKSVVEGVPKKKMRETVEKNAHPTRILVLGGSQGSQRLNLLWKRMLRTLSHEEKRKMAVIHITGERDSEAMRDWYQLEGVEAKVFSFYDRMEEIYPEVDLALARGGANTLFELTLYGLPAVIIPYPHAESHQERNARYFECRGGFVVLPEKEATPERLKENIFRLMGESALRERLSHNLKELAKPEAAERLVDLAEELIPKVGGRSFISVS